MPKASDDGAALLQAVIDNPDEDTPRLMYADWLDERGGESNAARAEFIRLQIAEAAARKNIHSIGLRISLDVTDRERQLIRRYAAGDAEGWHDVALPKGTGVQYDNSNQNERFERGFPWQVLAHDVDTFLALAPRLFAQAPITYLHLNHLTIKTARQLAESPHLTRIRQWQDASTRRTDKMLIELAKSPHIGNLREIDLTGTEITAAGVRALLFAPALRAMKRLTLSACEIGDAGAEAIAGSPACSTLEHLGLGYRLLTPAGVRALAAAPFRASVCCLSLSNARLDDAAALALAEAEWPRLQYLFLSNNHITDRGAAAFLDSARRRSPECKLWLHGNPLSESMRGKLRGESGLRMYA